MEPRTQQDRTAGQTKFSEQLNEQIIGLQNESASKLITYYLTNNSQISSEAETFIKNNLELLAPYIQKNDLNGIQNFLDGTFGALPEATRKEILDFFKKNMGKMNEIYEIQQKLSDAIVQGDTAKKNENVAKIKSLLGNNELAEDLIRFAIAQSALEIKKKTGKSLEEAFQIAAKNALEGGEILASTIRNAGIELGMNPNDVNNIMQDLMHDGAFEVIMQLRDQLNEMFKSKDYEKLEELLEETDDSLAIAEHEAKDAKETLRDLKDAKEENGKFTDEMIKKAIDELDELIAKHTIKSVPIKLKKALNN